MLDTWPTLLTACVTHRSAMATSPHLPEHITELQHKVLHEVRWALPEQIGYPDDGGVGYAIVPWFGALVSFVVLATLLVRLPVHKDVMAWLLLACFTALFWAWRHWWYTREPLGGEILDWRGCTVDVVQRTVTTIGHRKAQQWVLEPSAAWSIGIVPLPTNRKGPRRHALPCAIELRHVRRGPVLELCRIYCERDGISRRLALDQLAQHMAARLGVRFSGEGLVPKARDRGLLQ